MPSRPVSPPATSAWRGRRRTVLALVLVAVILIPAAGIYRAHRGAAGGGRESVAVMVKTAPGVASEAAAASAAPPPEARPESAARAGVDASNFYKDAFVLYAKLTEEEQIMFRKPPDELDPEKAVALFKKIQPILELLRQGAAADYCEWGIGEMDFSTNISHLTKSSELGYLATWSATYRFPADPQGAFGDLTAQTRLGEHVGENMIGWLIQMSMERRAGEVLRQNADLLDDAGLLQAQELLHSSTVQQNMARAYAAEVGLFDTTAKKISARTPAERVEYLNSILNGAPLPDAVRRLFQNEDSLTAELLYFQQFFRELAEEASRPEAQYQAWAQGAENSLSDHPLEKLMNIKDSKILEIYERHQQSQVERAMLSAGLTLLQGGPGPRAEFRDPVGGAAFAYVERADGFDLQSTFRKNGQPLTMSFTRR